jgi:hypothetical protein
MKNIHILPTDKPSRIIIYSTLLNEYRLLDEPILDWKHKKHIYITNDEIVTEYLTGLYFIDIDTGRNDIFSPIYINKETIAAGKFHTYMNNGSMCKKIIMTTDPQLIANGVQAIDDEFLEWFVKNPSCESVETKKVKWILNPQYLIYEIIIPKEEPKDRLRKVLGTKEPKQETLEEFIKSIYPSPSGAKIKGVKLGAKWQQEQDKNKYSEEEVLSILRRFELTYDGGASNSKLGRWFEQFKKK